VGLVERLIAYRGNYNTEELNHAHRKENLINNETAGPTGRRGIRESREIEKGLRSEKSGREGQIRQTLHGRLGVSPDSKRDAAEAPEKETRKERDAARRQNRSSISKIKRNFTRGHL